MKNIQSAFTGAVVYTFFFVGTLLAMDSLGGVTGTGVEYVRIGIAAFFAFAIGQGAA